MEEALAAQEAEELSEDQTSSPTPGVSTSISWMTTGQKQLCGKVVRRVATQRVVRIGRNPLHVREGGGGNVWSKKRTGAGRRTGLSLPGDANRRWRRRKPPKAKDETGQTMQFQRAQNDQAVRVDEPSGRSIWILYGDKSGIQMVRFQHSPDMPTLITRVQGVAR